MKQNDRLLAYFVFGLIMLAAFYISIAKAQDGIKVQDGIKAQDNERNWVDQLQNQQKDVCCYDNDGRRLTGPDWDTLGKVEADYNGMSGYRVYEDGKWYDVPNWAVVTMKNRDGIARVWWGREYNDGETVKKVKCFIPGTLV